MKYYKLIPEVLASGPMNRMDISEAIGNRHPNYTAEILRNLVSRGTIIFVGWKRTPKGDRTKLYALPDHGTPTADVQQSERVVKLLTRPKTNTEICQATGIQRRNLPRMLRKLLATGKVIRVKQKRPHVYQRKDSALRDMVARAPARSVMGMGMNRP